MSMFRIREVQEVNETRLSDRHIQALELEIVNDVRVLENAVAKVQADALRLLKTGHELSDDVNNREAARILAMTDDVKVWTAQLRAKALRLQELKKSRLDRF